MASVKQAIQQCCMQARAALQCLVPGSPGWRLQLLSRCCQHLHSKSAGQRGTAAELLVPAAAQQNHQAAGRQGAPAAPEDADQVHPRRRQCRVQGPAGALGRFQPALSSRSHALPCPWPDECSNDGLVRLPADVARALPDAAGNGGQQRAGGPEDAAAGSSSTSCWPPSAAAAWALRPSPSSWLPMWSEPTAAWSVQSSCVCLLRVPELPGLRFWLQAGGWVCTKLARKRAIHTTGCCRSWSTS